MCNSQKQTRSYLPQRADAIAENQAVQISSRLAEGTPVFL
jgi:hypothetical protein